MVSGGVRAHAARVTRDGFAALGMHLTPSRGAVSVGASEDNADRAKLASRRLVPVGMSGAYNASLAK